MIRISRGADKMDIVDYRGYRLFYRDAIELSALKMHIDNMIRRCRGERLVVAPRPVCLPSVHA